MGFLVIGLIWIHEELETVQERSNKQDYRETGKVAALLKKLLREDLDRQERNLIELTLGTRKDLAMRQIR